MPFFACAASEFVELFVGVGASRVRDLFEKVCCSPVFVLSAACWRRKELFFLYFFVFCMCVCMTCLGLLHGMAE